MSKRKQKLKKQTLVIPKGAIGPEDVVVIEIPKRFSRVPVLTVKKKQGSQAETCDDYLINAPKDFAAPPTNQSTPSPENQSTSSPAIPEDASTSAQTEPSIQVRPLSPPPVPHVHVITPSEQPSRYIIKSQCQTCAAEVLRQLQTEGSRQSSASSRLRLDLDETERAEYEAFREFQRARRNFLRSTQLLSSRLPETSSIESDDSD